MRWEFILLRHPDCRLLSTLYHRSKLVKVVLHQLFDLFRMKEVFKVLRINQELLLNQFIKQKVLIESAHTNGSAKQLLFLV